MDEKWKPIPGYEGHYEVSDLGRVRSLPREVEKSNGRTARYAGRILRQNKSTSGYPQVVLSKAGISPWNASVHCLVAEAFIGARPFGAHVCHGDGDKMNNCAANLRYDSPKGNAEDSIRHGISAKGEQNGAARLTPEAVLSIRTSFAKGVVSRKALATEHGVSIGHVSDILCGERWAHVGGPTISRAHGNKHGAILTAETVKKIRARYKAGGVTMRALAEEYGISRPAVSMLLSRKTWADV